MTDYLQYRSTIPVSKIGQNLHPRVEGNSRTFHTMSRYLLNPDRPLVLFPKWVTVISLFGANNYLYLRLLLNSTRYRLESCFLSNRDI